MLSFLSILVSVPWWICGVKVSSEAHLGVNYTANSIYRHLSIYIFLNLFLISSSLLANGFIRKQFDINVLHNCWFQIHSFSFAIYASHSLLSSYWSIERPNPISFLLGDKWLSLPLMTCPWEVVNNKWQVWGIKNPQAEFRKQHCGLVLNNKVCIL